VIYSDQLPSSRSSALTLSMNGLMQLGFKAAFDTTGSYLQMPDSTIRIPLVDTDSGPCIEYGTVDTFMSKQHNRRAKGLRFNVDQGVFNQIMDAHRRSGHLRGRLLHSWCLREGLDPFFTKQQVVIFFFFRGFFAGPKKKSRKNNKSSGPPISSSR